MIYLDASVTFSLYFHDGNTPDALRLAATATESLIVSALCEWETVNAFGLRVFRREMTERNLEIAVKDFQSDLNSAILRWRPFPETSFGRAITLSRRITPTIGVRAADLLHIAAALELGATTLYTLDRKQSKAAQFAGLATN